MVTSGSSRRRAVPGVLTLERVAHLVDGGEAEPHDVEGVRTRTARGRAVRSVGVAALAGHGERLPAERVGRLGVEPRTQGLRF